MRKGGQEVVLATVGVHLFFLGDLAVCDVLDREQDHLIAAIVANEPLSVQQHCLLADSTKIMGNFEVSQSADSRQNSFEQVAKPGNAPLAVRKIINMPQKGFLRPEMESIVKLVIGFL